MLYKRPFFIIRFLFMKHIIDIDTWERRDNYGFFRTFLNSWYSVTTRDRLYGGQCCCKTVRTLFFSLLPVCGSPFSQRGGRTPLPYRQERTGHFS